MDIRVIGRNINPRERGRGEVVLVEKLKRFCFYPCQNLGGQVVIKGFLKEKVNYHGYQSKGSFTNYVYKKRWVTCGVVKVINLGRDTFGNPIFQKVL